MEFREDLKVLFEKAAVGGKPVTFLFNDNQVGLDSSLFAFRAYVAQICWARRVPVISMLIALKLLYRAVGFYWTPTRWFPLKLCLLSLGSVSGSVVGFRCPFECTAVPCGKRCLKARSIEK